MYDNTLPGRKVVLAATQNETYRQRTGCRGGQVEPLQLVENPPHSACRSGPIAVEKPRFAIQLIDYNSIVASSLLQLPRRVPFLAYYVWR